MNRVISTVAILGLTLGLASTAQAEFLFDVDASAYDIGGATTIGSYAALDGSSATSPPSVTHNSITYNFASGRTNPTFTIPFGTSGSVSINYNAYPSPTGPGGQGWDTNFAETVRIDFVFPSVNNSGAVDSISQGLNQFQVNYTAIPSVAFPVGVHQGFLAISHDQGINNPLYRDLASPNGTSNGTAGADYTLTANFPLTIIVNGPPPVPEPASILVWGGLGLSIAGARWYRRRKAGR